MSINNEKNRSVSFGFSKINEKKNLKDSILKDEEPVILDNKKYVTSIDKNQPVEEKIVDLIIPLIKKNRWCLKPEDIENDTIPKNVENKNLIKNKIKTGDKLVDEAIEEILHDAANFNETKTESYLDLQIPILLQNKVPGNFETDEKLDVKLRPDSNIEDYNDVPIEAFGMAMLRGMGWNEQDKSIKLKEVKVRPKGLGLAADKSVAKQLEDFDDKTDRREKLLFQKGTHCIINNGRLNGKYGIIMGIDEDNSRVVLSVANETITVSRYSVRLITKNDFDRGHRCINQQKVDEYKKINEPVKDNLREPKLESSEEIVHRKRKSDKSDKNDSDKKIRSDKNESEKLFSWLHPLLRVRFIDKKFQSGRYYKTKLIIEDLTSRSTCVCKTEEGKILENIRSEQLETVVPKKVPAFVMVLSGKYKFQLGELLDQNSKDSIGHVQLLSDRDILLKLDFNDICEYTGNVDNHIDY